ncbi:MspA family porin [Mycobacteroides salmoniphilum]|uniref:MspA n=1 Tax=Mycobacteroides salmoniphilum TaxID=404941 RepID=A0A4R8SU35_9MYCO|nr:MspA family porin [Mycobacteroides salmoniphilum]TDZ93376.1 MspA [Mycobacteroides salmoniphilum]TEA03993.1 MspA [Mycobacteroides salmoniphilum]
MKLPNLARRSYVAAIATSVAVAMGLMVDVSDAAADPQGMPDQYQQFVTDDGWTVGLTLTNEVIDHIDNIAGASNSWQARVSYRAEATITGSGSAVIQDAQLETGYFVGCRTDSSSGVELGGDLGLTLSQQVFGQGYGGGYGQGSQSGGGGGGFGGVSGGGSLGAQEHIGGYMRVLLKPGGLAQLPMDRINFRNMRAVSQVRNQNVEADGCGGQVKIQSFATFRIRTENGNDTQTIYGEPKDL